LYGCIVTIFSDKVAIFGLATSAACRARFGTVTLYWSQLILHLYLTNTHVGP
jgi:hypothetical protein